MAVVNEENPGSIDNIPYEILHQIVSLIPLKEAARTIILSSSWKHLWRPLHVSLNQIEPNQTDFDQTTSQESTQHIHRTISTFLTPYQILNLHINPTLFLKAIKGADNELYLSFHGSQNLKTFGLSIDMGLCQTDHFSSLKTLYLRSVTGEGETLLPALFSGCRNLETLSIEKCSGLEEVELKGHEVLQRFVVLDCEKMKRVTILSAPKLKCFLYRGRLVKIRVKDAPKLCDVSLNMKGCDGSDFDGEDVVPLLATFKDVEVLTLSGWLLEWFCKRGVVFDELEFKFEKLKELSWMDGCMNTHKRDSLASFLSITPSLENLFIKIDEKWSTIPSLHFDGYWPQTLKNNDFQLKHLKMVEFWGFKMEEEDKILVSLMDILMKKAIAMKKMSVRALESKKSWRVAKVPQSHLKKMKMASKSSLLWSLNNQCCFHLTQCN